MAQPPPNRSRPKPAAALPDATSPALPLPEPLGAERAQPAKEVYVTWTNKISTTHKAQLADMIATAPRHVRVQDLIGFILTEFFRQHPELPEELRQRAVPRI